MKYNGINSQRLSSANLSLGFGVFTICASLVFAWIMYYFPTNIPPLKLFLFPVVCFVFCAQAIFSGLKKILYFI